MVAVLAKPGADILREMTPDHWRLLSHAIFGAVQIGHRVDMIKKQVIYQKPLGIELAASGALPEGLTAEKCHLLHMAIGIFGEAAELLEAVYRHCEDNTPLDLENVVEELGDGEFYTEGFRQGVGVTVDEYRAHNKTKLSKRYEGFQYSNTAAQARADKA